MFTSVEKHRTHPGLIPYSVNAPLWSDGAYKERYLALPAGETISLTRTRGWNFPDRTVLVKSFAIERKEGDPASRKWIETRFLTKQGGEWYGYTYLWNDAGTDAELLDAKGADKEFTVATPAGPRKQVWHYPSRAECMVCHSRAANFVLGLCTPQMNTAHDYGTGADNQVRACSASDRPRWDRSTVPETSGSTSICRSTMNCVIDSVLRANSPKPM